MNFEELNELYLNDFDTFVVELLYAFNNTIDEDKVVLLLDVLEHWNDARCCEIDLAKQLRALV